MTTDTVTKEELRDAYLICRTLGHGWEETPNDDLPPPDVKGDWWFVVTCVRCTTKRIALIDASGEYVRMPRYVHPDGYQLDERATRSEMRAEWAYRASLGTFGQHKVKG